jgi:hypothetical protein
VTFQLSHKHGAVQFAQVVSENVPAFDQAFWLRIASRADAAPAGEKEQLQALASTTMGLVDSMMKETESQLESGGQVVQDILKAGATGSKPDRCNATSARAHGWKSDHTAHSALLHIHLPCSLNGSHRWLSLLAMLSTLLWTQRSRRLADNASQQREP